MQLSGIHKFKFKPKKDKIVIIGPNGAGKSRLLSIIYPHAVTPVELEDGGYIKHKYTNGKDHFKFEQVKRGKQLKCTIIKNDVVVIDECNPTVYNESVTSIFNFDKKFLSILFKKPTLTSMRAPERKHWFGQLATSDLTDALKYFKIMKEFQRDNLGAIKVTERYVVDMKPLVLKDKSELDALNGRLKELETQYEFINQHWVTYQGGTNDLDRHLESLETVSQKIHNTELVNTPDVNYINKMIEELLADKNHRVKFIIPRIDTELTNLENELKEAEYYTKNLVAFEEKLTKYKDRLTKLKSTENVFLSEVVTLSELTINATLGELETFLSTISKAIGKLVSADSLETLKGMRDKQSILVESAKDELFVLRGKLNSSVTYYEQHSHIEDVDCPHCKKGFKPGVDKNLDEIANKISQLKPKVEVLEGKHQLELEKLNTLIDNVTVREEMQATVLEWRLIPGFTSLVNYIQHSHGFSPSLNLSIWVDEYREALTTALTIIKTESDLQESEDKRLIAAACAGKDKLGVENKINRLTEDAQNEHLKVAELEKKISDSKKVLARAQYADELGVELNTLHSGLDAVIESQMRFNLSAFLSKTKDELWGLITSVRERKVSLDKMAEELAYNESVLVKLKKEKKGYDETVNGLSPNGGLLAEYLYRSIYSITDTMNLFISEVFNYPLTISPCDVEDGELDYKFPFIEGDSKTERSDVSIGSEGQQEIFNNSFVLAAVKALRLEGRPLLLDEPGRTFSPGHRQNYADFVESLYSTNYCSQIFVISHFSEFHTRLGSVEYIVLGDDGVELPDVYNENVEINK